MHPLFAKRVRLALYLLGWLMLAVLLALLVLEPERSGVLAALNVIVPPVLAYAFVCLAAWYPVRAMPLQRTGTAALLASHTFAAIALSGVWVMALDTWAAWLGVELDQQRIAAFFVTGVLLYLLSVAFNYMLAGLERELEVRMLARDAELKALKAQLDPHFLFNSLNSISSLCGSNPASARTLTTLLAEYLRKSLRIGSAETVTLSEELELVSSYLAIERIRFGPRLELVQEVEEGVRGHRVPPLILQPLVENAIKHGIAHLLEGGVVQIAAARDGDGVRIEVENACDPDRAPQQGENIGLANTRRRIEMFEGSMNVVDEPARFRVTLWLP
ncbi:MAG TPA: histidine kinase [Thermoanaerobaculia bacterium]|nr:histidine kinase [Thermoanaerobaculia bacterium]